MSSRRWTLTKVVRHLAPIIKGNFEGLNFEKHDPNVKTYQKTCYLSLSPKLDPVEIVDRINKNTTEILLKAFIPTKMPDLPKDTVNKKIPYTLRHLLNIPEEENPGVVMVGCLWELLKEINTKYYGLQQLSQKSNDKLMDLIAKVIADRLKAIVKNNKTELCDTYYRFTELYRKTHPHFTDFELITKCLNKVNEETGEKFQTTEANLLKMPDNVVDFGTSAFEKIIGATEKYAESIAKQVSEHVESLDSVPTQLDSVEEVAQKKIRTELKKVNNYIERIIQQVITKHMVPRKVKQANLCLYGEPHLPAKNVMNEFLQKYNLLKMNHSNRMYNLMHLTLKPEQYADFIALDGTIIKGAKLMIRPKNYINKKYNMPESILKELNTFDDAQKFKEINEEDYMDDSDCVVEWK